MQKFIRLLPWLLLICLATLLLAGTIHKALTASFTHDESFTYNHYVTAPLADIFSYKLVSPNNHLLNTLLMKTGAHFFGPSEIVLRFPNILAYLGFMLFTLLILKRQNPWLILPLFALLNCNPYLLDFFALARGNGMSYCFLMGSIFFFITWTGSGKLVHYAWSVVFVFLGVLSHFTMIYYILSLFILVNLWPLLQRHFNRGSSDMTVRHFIRINSISAVCIAMLVIIMTAPVLKLLRAGQLFYGGDRGFWKDTVGSLVETFFYGMKYGQFLSVPVQILVLAVTASVAGVVIWIILKRDPALFSANRVLFIVFFLLIITIMINVSQFYLVGTRLMIRRYGLLFVPLFMLCSSFLFVFLLRLERFKVSFLIIAYCLAFAVASHTFSAFSAKTYLDWEYEKDTRNVTTILEKDVLSQHLVRPVTLGITWLFEPTVNFYRQTRKLGWLQEVNRDGPSNTADYYYILREDMARVPLRGHIPVILFDDGKVMLVRVIPR